MTGEDCRAMRLLVQADMDGELTPAEAAGVRAHLRHCAACAEMQAGIMALSARLRTELPYYPASSALRAAVRAKVAAVAPISPAPSQWSRPSWSAWRRLGKWGPMLPFGGGLAVAASLALLLLIPRTDAMPGAVVSGHIRALQPGHLMDVVSTDRHTVKPWFDGRLDYAPPVKDLAPQGFPLEGGRLDVLAGRPVAALVYRHRQHMIDVYVVPGATLARADGAINGYNFVRWSQGGMNFWAVSDVAATDLAEFVRLWLGA